MALEVRVRVAQQVPDRSRPRLGDPRRGRAPCQRHHRRPHPRRHDQQPDRCSAEPPADARCIPGRPQSCLLRLGRPSGHVSVIRDFQGFRPGKEWLSEIGKISGESARNEGSRRVMHSCCPPSHGCNSAGDHEPCALVLCHMFASVEPDAALAVTRWTAVEKAQKRPGEGGREPRFRRRAYERVRDRALVAIAMRSARRLVRPAADRHARRSSRARIHRGDRTVPSTA